MLLHVVGSQCHSPCWLLRIPCRSDNDITTSCCSRRCPCPIRIRVRIRIFLLSTRPTRTRLDHPPRTQRTKPCCSSCFCFCLCSCFRRSSSLSSSLSFAWLPFPSCPLLDPTALTLPRHAHNLPTPLPLPHAAPSSSSSSTSPALGTSSTPTATLSLYPYLIRTRTLGSSHLATRPPGHPATWGHAPASSHSPFPLLPASQPLSLSGSRV